MTASAAPVARSARDADVVVGHEDGDNSSAEEPDANRRYSDA
jgi:hypothetical protein